MRWSIRRRRRTTSGRGRFRWRGFSMRGGGYRRITVKAKRGESKSLSAARQAKHARDGDEGDRSGFGDGAGDGGSYRDVFRCRDERGRTAAGLSRGDIAERFLLVEEPIVEVGVRVDVVPD